MKSFELSVGIVKTENVLWLVYYIIKSIDINVLFDLGLKNIYIKFIIINFSQTELMLNICLALTENLIDNSNLYKKIHDCSNINDSLYRLIMIFLETKAGFIELLNKEDRVPDNYDAIIIKIYANLNYFLCKLGNSELYTKLIDKAFFLMNYLINELPIQVFGLVDPINFRYLSLILSLIKVIISIVNFFNVFVMKILIIRINLIYLFLKKN